MKLWWVHLETMIATLMAYEVTKDPNWWNTFEEVANYSFETFSDPINGEWYGYVSRTGELINRWKGGPFKGCFHLPRALSIIERILTKLIKENEEFNPESGPSEIHGPEDVKDEDGRGSSSLSRFFPKMMKKKVKN